MSANTTSVAKKPLSGFFTALSVILFLGGFYIAGSSFLAAKPWYFRLFIVCIGVLLAVGSLKMSNYWAVLKDLAYGARVEIRKVFWPAKDELIKTTIMVLVIVTIFAIFLTIVDGLLTLLVQWVL